MSDQIAINVTPNPSILINAIDHQQSIALNPITLNQGLINHGITHISGGSDEVLHNSLRNQGGKAGEYYHLTANQYSGVVYTTGDQNISGVKTFLTGINVSGAVSIASPSGSIDYAGIQLSGYNRRSLFQSIQNTAASVSGSTDISLYNDTGAYLDLGIASSTYNGNLFSPTFNIVNSGDSYIYSTAKNFVVGTASSGDVVFFTSGTLSGNERMRITAGGNVGIGTSTPSSTAILELSSTGRGFLPPRLTTTQRNVIASPADGLVIYNSTQTNLNTYNSGISGWEAVVDSDYVQNVSTLTQAQYNALSGGPVATTLYIITDAPSAGTSIANIASKTADYTITSSDYCINVTAIIPTTITLPSAIGLAGYIFVIKNSGTSTVTVSAAAGEFIDATSTVSLSTRYSSVRVQSLGTSTGYIIT